MTKGAIDWKVLAFTALSSHVLHDILQLRVEVFVVEQNCAYQEVDGMDLPAFHVIGREGDGEIVAYCRILPPGEKDLPHIGRVIVRSGHRGRGVGHELMQVALHFLVQEYGQARSVLAAQSHLQDFYAAHGYEPVGNEYVLDGIPHRDMVRDERPAI